MVRLSSATATWMATTLVIATGNTGSVSATRIRGQSEASIHRRRLQKEDNNMNNNNNVQTGTTTLGQLFDNQDAGGDTGGGGDTGNNGGGNNNNVLPEGLPETSPNAVCAANGGAADEYVDVIIIGAGMAGVQAAATLRAQDPSLTYVVLESTNRVGGRVRSVDFGGVKIEDGANWIMDFQGNPVKAMAESLGDFQHPLNDWSDYVTYDENGVLIDQTFVVEEEMRFMNAWDSAIQAADEQWAPDHEDFPDNGVRSLLADNGWEVQSNLDFTIEWNILDFEYAAKDTSVRYFPYFILPAHHVSDMRGYEFLVQKHFADSVDTTALRSDKRVSQVNYDENVVANGVNYKAVVSTSNDAGGCADYYGQRVISTVSSGVINNDLIAFNPPLAFPAQDFSPYYMTQYVKIFYQFDTQFWDNTQLVRTVRDEANRGHCHHWANMAATGFNEGSNIIRCEIMTEAFDELVDPVTQDLEDATLMALLDPLRTTYGSENVPTPINMYYPKLNKDRDFGFGAYSNWKTGATFTQFAHMYGGIEDVVPYCEHNGCNSNGEWTMMISGSATCYEHAEFVHGAYFSGEKAANNVLRELGYDVPNDVSPCDEDSWQWLK